MEIATTAGTTEIIVIIDLMFDGTMTQMIDGEMTIAETETSDGVTTAEETGEGTNVGETRTAIAGTTDVANPIANR